jgi:hypothetical protein
LPTKLFWTVSANVADMALLEATHRIKEILYYLDANCHMLPKEKKTA